MSTTGDPHASGPHPWSRDAAAESGQPTWPTYPGTTPQPPAVAPGAPYVRPDVPDPGFDPQPTPPYAGGIYGTAPAPGIPADPYAPDPYAPESYGQQPNRATPDPYAPTPYAPSAAGYGTYGVAQPTHPQATLGMVLGIIGLSTSFMCIGGLIGIPALIISQKVKREIDATPGRYAGRGMATAGIVTGILAIIAMALTVAFVALGAAADAN